MSTEQPPTLKDGDTRKTITVTLDFEKMMEQVLEKHWGWWGDRPESFEEYCCMLAAYELAQDVQRNEFRASKIVEKVRLWLDDEGERLAKSEAATVKLDAPNMQWSDSTAADYYSRQVAVHLDALARQHAHMLHAMSIAEAEAAS